MRVASRSRTLAKFADGLQLSRSHLELVPKGLSGWVARDSKRLFWPLGKRAMWAPATRRQHSRAGLQYETDLTDAEWLLVAPLLPAPNRTGRPRSWPLREIVNAIFYVMRGGVAWRLPPSDLPPKSTAYRWFAAWRDKGVLEALNHALLMIDRERCGRSASPSGLVLFAHPASVQDRDGAGPLLAASRRTFPFIEKAFADAGYQGPRVATATRIAVEIVRRKPDQIGFAVQPRRWVVERFFAWINRNRRLWKDAEATIASATAFLYGAAAMVLIRRIARQS